MEASKIPRQDVQWIAADKSLQWRYTLKTLSLLKEQGNDILAVVTPFNIYMLTEESAKQHELIVNSIRDNLASEGITAVIPEIPRKRSLLTQATLRGKATKLLQKTFLRIAGSGNLLNPDSQRFVLIKNKF
jgi:hypothetical protein